MKHILTRITLVVLAQVSQRNGDTCVQEGQFAHTVGQDVIFVSRSGKDGRIGPEVLTRTAQVGSPPHFHRSLRMSLGIFLSVNFTIAEHLRHHFGRQGIHTAHTHAVQTARHFVRAFVELTAGMQHGHHHFKGRASFFGVHIHGDTASVVLYND